MSISKKRPIPGLKEVNPLLKSLNIDKMNSSQIQEEISKEEKILNNLISHYKYPEAEISDKKIAALKNVLKQKKAKEIKQRHTAEKEHLKIDEFADVNNLKFYWDKKFEELRTRSQAAFDELKRNQEMEYQQLIAQKEMETNVKPSRDFLKYQKEEEGLVKLRKFKEAEVIRKKKEEQRKNDLKRTGKNKINSIKCLEKKLRQKHTNELLFLQNKFQSEFDDLTNQRLKQVEFINKKYSVKNKDLMNQQKRENNINRYTNYGRRIEQLTNYYGQKFIVGQNEYAPQKQIENADQIYAELPDNKIEGFENESSPEKNADNEGNGIYQEDSDNANRQQEIVQK